MPKYLVKFVSVGRPGSLVDGSGWKDDAVEVPGEPIAVIEDKSMVRIYFKEEIKQDKQGQLAL